LFTSRTLHELDNRVSQLAFLLRARRMVTVDSQCYLQHLVEVDSSLDMKKSKDALEREGVRIVLPPLCGM
jgi:hypothetical protein